MVKDFKPEQADWVSQFLFSGTLVILVVCHREKTALCRGAIYFVSLENCAHQVKSIDDGNFDGVTFFLTQFR